MLKDGGSGRAITAVMMKVIGTANSESFCIGHGAGMEFKVMVSVALSP
jgi:hypothetical protein